MKKLQKSDLKEGEIYKQLIYNYIFLYNKNETFDSFNDGTAISSTRPRYFKRWTANGFEKDMIEATLEEKHWLETCIKADQFVFYEEAMKTFIPEYYEYIVETKLYNAEFIKGKTYKIVNKNNLEAEYNFINEKGIANGWSGNNWKHFKPSTKEAYDAQFVVKEPEFVLPKLWCIKLTVENQKTVIDYINKNTNDGERSGNIGMYYGYNGEHCTCIFKTLSNTEITFDQFKQYVLKENTTVTEEPKVVLEEPKDKVLTLSSNYGKESIVKVECSEGGVYRIGDKITVFDKYSPNKGKPFTIKSFRWTNDKSKICAVTELHTPNGIGLDKIELYVEPKVKQELSLLEQAKLKYPIGTKVKSLFYNSVQGNIININFKHCGIWADLNTGKGIFLYSRKNNKWAEIIEDFKLPEKWCVQVNSENENFINSVRDRSCSVTFMTSSLILPNVKNSWYCDSDAKKRGFTEITFEQFKKYVLKDE